MEINDCIIFSGLIYFCKTGFLSFGDACFVMRLRKNGNVDVFNLRGQLVYDVPKTAFRGYENEI